MKMNHPIGALIGIVVSGWASFTFLRGSITGSPPLYSTSWLQRVLHLVAGIIFGVIALGLGLMLTR